MGVKVYINKNIKPKHMVLIGLFAIVVASLIFFFNYKEQARAKDYVETYGRVVDYYTQYDDGTTTYSEIVEYDVNGHSYYCSSSSYSSFPKSIGGEMKVKYDKRNPNECLIENKSGDILVYVVCGVFVVIGVGLVVIGARGNYVHDDREDI
jgi:hypothetical protein